MTGYHQVSNQDTVLQLCAVPLTAACLLSICSLRLKECLQVAGQPLIKKLFNPLRNVPSVTPHEESRQVYPVLLHSTKRSGQCCGSECLPAPRRGTKKRPRPPHSSADSSDNICQELLSTGDGRRWRDIRRLSVT